MKLSIKKSSFASLDSQVILQESDTPSEIKEDDLSEESGKKIEEVLSPIIEQVSEDIRMRDSLIN